MATQSASPLALCLLLLCPAPAWSQSQSPTALLARMDQFAKTFTGAQAAIRTTNHIQGIPDDDIEAGTIFVKRSGAGTQFLIAFKEPNVYTAALREQIAEVYRPKLNEIQEYDLRAYKDIAQKFFLLGFGMPGRELAANYEIRNVTRETIASQPTTHLELIPKSPAVLKQLKSVEVWISDATQCPARQVFHMPDGGSRTAEFSALQVNPKLPANAFDLPKGAKRVHVN